MATTNKATKKELTKQELVSRATKALMNEVSSFYGGKKPSSRGSGLFEDTPNYTLSQVVNMMRSDSVAWGGAVTIQDRVLENGWEIVAASTGERMPEFEQTLMNKGFEEMLRDMVLHFVIFQNAFGELVYTDAGNVKELHVVDPTQMAIHTNEHNVVKQYEQMPESGAVLWSPEEILHVKDSAIDLSQWGEVSARTIYQAVAIKYHVKKLIGWLFETNQFRGIYNPTAADPESIKRFMTFLKESERDIKKPVIVEGEFEYQVMREMKDLDKLNTVLYKMDEEILNYLQVPPIYAGLPDNSNRSNSDAQERAFNTRVRNIQKIFERHVNELLKRMKMYGVRFQFRPISIKVTKEVLEAAQLLISMNVKEEVVADYLRNNGISLPKGNVFKEVEQPNNDLLTQDQAPSRRGKGVDQANEKIGTGEESTTREDQLVSRTFPFFVEDE